jgi:hypothetical protein
MGVGNVFVLRRGVRGNTVLLGLLYQRKFQWADDPIPVRDCYWPDGHWHNLLSVGEAVRRAHEPSGDASLFWGKIKPWDATFYVIAHFIGALIDWLLVALFMNSFLSDPSVNYIVTVLGEPGAGFAFLAESRSEHALYVRQSYGIDGETAGVPGALRQGKAIH